MAGTPSPSTRESRRDRTRAELVEIARGIVLEGGAQALSLREVARRAGYAPGALYTYFDGKEALVAALGLDATLALTSYLDSVDPATPPRARLEALSRQYLKFAADEPERYTSVFSGLSVGLDSWEEFVSVGRPFTAIVAAFSDGIGQGVFQAGQRRTADAMAFGLWSLLHGAVVLRAGFLRAMSGQLETPTCDAVSAYLEGLCAPYPPPSARMGKAVSP
jgi:AcrR family transcriptional regulator